MKINHRTDSIWRKETKILKKDKDHRDLLDNIKCINTSITETPERR